MPPWIHEYIGLPYEPGGRTRAGIDCWGIVRLVLAERLGVTLPDYTGPAWRRGHPSDPVGRSAEAYAEGFARVPEAEARLGDGILIRMRGLPIHVGLVVVPGVMLHVEEGVGSALEQYGSLAWRRRILGFYRPPASGQGG